MKGRKHILVVDDSETNRTLERLVLESEGYTVTTAASGDEAWEWLQTHAVDAVVTDVDMPGMNGLALTAAIRKSARLMELPVVVMSGTEAASEANRITQSGASAYLGKSDTDMDDLLRVIGDLV